MRKKKNLSAVEIRSFGPKSNFIFNVLLALVSLSCLIPFIFIIILSFTSEKSISMNGYSFWPAEWSLGSYRYLSTMGGQVLRSFGVSVFVTVVGTALSSLFSSSYGYAISRADFAFARFFTIFALISMLFVPGMVPTYLVVTQMLGLRDNVWALILPTIFNVYNMLIMRTFFKTSISEAILESARIDGASESTIFWKIVVPLAIPGIATISLFSALTYWNDWFSALLYMTNDTYIPLQYLLIKIQDNLTVLTQQMAQGLSTVSAVSLPAEGIRFAVVVVATLPIALTYPFFEKYFVKGLTIGGVKG